MSTLLILISEVWNILQNKEVFIVFFDIFKELCNNIGSTPTSVIKQLGLSTSKITAWKNGSSPKSETLHKIADYFEVTTDYLLGKTNIKKPLVNNDEELTEYLEELRTRPELKMLFKLAKGATKTDVEKAVKIVEAFLEDK